MKIYRLFLILMMLELLGSNALLNAQPVPYPDVPTSGDTKVEVKGDQNGNSNESSSSTDAGTQKSLVSINNGSKGVMGAWSMNVKFEGKNVSRLSTSTQNHSETGTGIDCSQYPNHCSMMVYEFMKKELPQAKLRTTGRVTLEAAAEASLSLRKELGKQVKTGGLWVRLSDGKWIRIDKDVMLTKAVINQLWRKGR